MNELLNILSSVGFNWHVALANFFNFLIILFLLHTFFFKKLATGIRERPEDISRASAIRTIAASTVLGIPSSL
jgi:Na+/H+ antiporter NhaD/arsenite permease-like protein